VSHATNFGLSVIRSGPGHWFCLCTLGARSHALDDQTARIGVAPPLFGWRTKYLRFTPHCPFCIWGFNATRISNRAAKRAAIADSEIAAD
jgi:hypothetical protein